LRLFFEFPPFLGIAKVHLLSNLPNPINNYFCTCADIINSQYSNSLSKIFCEQKNLNFYQKTALPMDDGYFAGYISAEKNSRKFLIYFRQIAVGNYSF